MLLKIISLLRCSGFPVLLLREFRRKCPSQKGFPQHEWAPSKPEFVIFPVFFPVTREFKDGDRFDSDCVRHQSVAARRRFPGAAGFGLGAALYGAITLKDGKVEQTNFDGYQVLRIDEMPKAEVHVVQSPEAPTGVGEPGHATSLDQNLLAKVAMVAGYCGNPCFPDR